MKTKENLDFNKSLSQTIFELEKAQEIGNFGHWILEIETGELKWSKQIYFLFKLSPDEFKPSYENFLSAIHPDDREMVNNAYQTSLINKTPYQIEHRLLYKDGSIAYVSERCETQYNKNGDPIRSIGIVHDITKRVLSDRKLIESEEKFRAYANQSSEGVTVADMEGNYVFTNPAFCKMSGYTEKELLNLTVFDMKAANQDHSSFKESKEKSAGKPIRVNLVRKDGEEYLTEIIGDVININGKELVLGTVRDITQQVKNEKEIKALNENLEQLVKDRTNELDKTISNLQKEVGKRIEYEKQIQQSLKVKDVLLKEITHRVKNNLQIISSLLNLQKETIENQESAMQLDQTVNRIQSMALIHEILHSSNQYEEVRIDNYVNSLINYTINAIDNSKIEFKINVGDLKLSVDSATNCGMIIMELVTNSIKHAFENINNPTIRIDINKLDGEKLELSYSDNGTGFPKDIDFKKTKSLGMQIVVSLVEQNDGNIILNSNNGKGTAFKILIHNQQKRKVLSH